MKRAFISLATLAFSASVAGADAVPAADVVFEDGAVSMSLSGVAGDAEAGKKVMTTRGQGNCIACHQVTALADSSFHGEIGPSLDGTGSRWDEAQLRGIVANAKMMFDGSMMPSFYKKSGYIRPGDGFTGKAIAEADMDTLLSAQQIEDVVAFLMTLKDQ